MVRTQIVEASITRHGAGHSEKFADNLKRELPRIPLAPACRPVAGAPGSDQSANADQNPERERGAGGKDARGALADKPPVAPDALLESSGTRGGAVAGAPGSDQSADADQNPERERGANDQSRDREGAVRPREGAGRYQRPTRGSAATGGRSSADGTSAATGRPVRGPAARHRQDAGATPSNAGATHSGGGATYSDADGTDSRAGSLCHKSSGFWAFAEAGRRLAELHIGYESVKPWPLKWVETPGEPLSYRVEKMRLSKDRKSLKVNDSLTLGGIPPEVFEYRLGNRSGLEWVIDQYRVKEDKRSGIRSDPNNADDPEYIVRLVGQVVRVSVETVRIVKGLPERYAPPGGR